MSRHRCTRLTVPAELHLHPVARGTPIAGDLLVADWKLRGAWRHAITDDTTPLHGVPTVGAA